MEKQMPTREQIEALRTFATINGRTWKSKLNLAWQTGNYGDYGIEGYGDTAAYLQQVRNSFGPSWLARFTFAKDGAWMVFSSADCLPPECCECGKPLPKAFTRFVCPSCKDMRCPKCAQKHMDAKLCEYSRAKVIDVL